MGEMRWQIGEVAAAFGLRVSALRYYEERGLLTAAERRSGRRYYGHAELRRLALIQMWQESGQMRLAEIESLITGVDSTDRPWHETVREHLARLDDKVEMIKHAKEQLEHMLTAHSDSPAPPAECPVLHEILQRTVDKSLENMAPGSPECGK